MYSYQTPAIGTATRTQNLMSTNAVPVETKINRMLPVIGSEASRCADCGSAGCFMGTGGDATGCPFARRIPDIHIKIEQAIKILNEANAYLKDINPDLHEKIRRDYEALQEGQGVDLSDINARYPLVIFEALESSGFEGATHVQEIFDARMREAFKISYEGGPMGDIYGRICPESLCQKSCTPQLSGHGAVQIRMNEAALWDYSIMRGFYQPISPSVDRSDQSVVVVASGFAGFAVAERAREDGYHVVLVDKNSDPGEIGDAKILSYKANIERFRRHYDRLRDSGVEIICNTTIGQDGEGLESLRQRFNASAIVLCVGTPFSNTIPMELDVPDVLVDWHELTKAMHEANHEKRPYDSIPDKFKATGKKVVIIGNGDTAVDCVRASLYQGASEIVVTSRTKFIKAESQDYEAFEKMKLLAQQYGVSISFELDVTPQKIIKNEKGNSVLIFRSTQSKPAGELSGDMFVVAAGTNTGDQRAIFEINNMPVNNNGSFSGVYVPDRIANKSEMMGRGASFLGMLNGTFVFAAGQCVRGDSLAAVAGRDGMDAQKWMHEALENTENFKDEIHQLSGRPPLVLEG